MILRDQKQRRTGRRTALRIRHTQFTTSLPFDSTLECGGFGAALALAREIQSGVTATALQMRLSRAAPRQQRAAAQQQQSERGRLGQDRVGRQRDLLEWV